MRWPVFEGRYTRLTLGRIEIALDAWTVYGSPRDCVETLRRAAAMGLERVGFTIYSLPREVQARIDYMQMIVEEIVRPVAA